MNKITTVTIAALLLLGCAANNSQTNKLTLGTVQKTVSESANQTGIVEAMGAPNIITNDSNGRPVVSMSLSFLTFYCQP